MHVKEKIVIVGFGWVGQANALALARMGYPVFHFDPGNPPRHYEEYAALYPRIPRLDSVREEDSENTCYIVCVGDRVGEDGVQDIGSIRVALDHLRGVEGTVVLRSTIIPDQLGELSFDYYVPEFLHEKYAVAECLRPYYFVVGAHDARRREPSFFRAWRSTTPRYINCAPREAAHIKYLSNLWNAVRIAFVNEFGDTIATPDSLERIASIHRVIDFVLEGEPYQRYGKGFAGHCLPKDMRAFAHWYKEKGKHVDLLNGAYQSNAKHEARYGASTDLPEWFSAWSTPHVSGVVALRELWHSVWKNARDPKEFVLRRLRHHGFM